MGKIINAWLVKMIGLLMGASVQACVSTMPVRRLFQGQISDGPAISPEVYASFFRGSLAEQEEDWNRAVAFYQEALRLSGGDPFLQARLELVRARLSGRWGGRLK
ncbi:tetratricopeptide repeat protein [Pajaroellobacter abortibovis]|uniref:tetratricopeptide repeat protein n=1 Tax=Pajaroellobacter abortibovis TaxID=1882918 RepID=UPI0012EB808B|nr:hypothetical protein [Pajaroellobacter abortibovis]